jgi:hypothetical protein
LLCTSRRTPCCPWISLTNSLEVTSFSRGEAGSIFQISLGAETVEKHRDAMLEFAERMERLPIAIVVGADLLRRELDSIPNAARHRRTVRAGPAAAQCDVVLCPRDLLPLTVQIAGLTEAEGLAARDSLVDASLLRMLDRDRQRFQLHALLREDLLNLCPTWGTSGGSWLFALLELEPSRTRAARSEGEAGKADFRPQIYFLSS